MQSYEVIVSLKKEVLDPEGRAIKETLVRLGFHSVQDIQVSKRFVVNLKEGASEEEAAKIAEEFLVNSVSEEFVLRKLQVEAQ